MLFLQYPTIFAELLHLFETYKTPNIKLAIQITSHFKLIRRKTRFHYHARSTQPASMTVTWLYMAVLKKVKELAALRCLILKLANGPKLRSRASSRHRVPAIPRLCTRAKCGSLAENQTTTTKCSIFGPSISQKTNGSK